MNRKIAVLVAALLAGGHMDHAYCDDLTRMVQADLISLGYDPGEPNGEASTKTIIAVAKFQTEHNLEPTGEITPQLAGVIQAAIEQQQNPGNNAQTALAAQPQTTPEQDQATLHARQQACLQEKAAAAEKANSMKRGLGKLFSAISRTTGQFGAPEVAGQISSTTSDIYSVDASVSDIQGAAKDLGLSESDVEACRNP
jgi:peptidoglycan hydrolase-like protein with peptidoglycan-binding domain